MAIVIHIAEVAAILAVAYVVGWLIGYFARRYAASRPRRVEMPAEIAAAVAAATDADALVKAPEIVAVADSRPVAPSQPVELTAVVLQPDVPPIATGPSPADAVSSAAAVVEPTPAPMPAEPPAPAVQSAAPQPLPKAIPLPIRTTLPPMDIPPMDLSPIVAPPPIRIEPLARVPKAAPLPELAPLPEPEPTVPFTATPAMRPGEAWSGAIRGRSAAPEPVPEPKPSAEVFAQPPIEVPVTLELTETIAFVAEPEPAAERPVEPESTSEAPQTAIETPPAPPPPAAPSAASYDEDAAMRAIEGGWSRVKSRALPDSPELSDVGAAVAAAQSAVEQVLAQAGIDAESSPRASKPTGLALPRAGRKDDLKRINGLGALDESTLNNLGVFHFDQIAAWDETQVFWMENHVFARGRIGHEKWQQQARDLAAAVAG